MTDRDETVYLRHMLDAIDRIAEYVADLEEEAFLDDRILQDAVVRQLEILGEAAGRVSKATCETSPSIPWAKITGMRHRLIHDYFEVDLALVWDVVTKELDELRPNVAKMLAPRSVEE